MKKLFFKLFLGLLISFASEVTYAARVSNGLSCSSKGDDESQGIDEIRVKRDTNGSYSFTFHPSGGTARTASGLSCIFVDAKNIITPKGQPLEFTDISGGPVEVTLPLMRCQKGDLVIRGTLAPMIYAIPFTEEIKPAGPRYEIIIKNNPFSPVRKPIYRFGTGQTNPNFDCKEL